MTVQQAHFFRLAALRGDGLRSLMAAVDALSGVASPEGRRRVLVDLQALSPALPHTEAVILCHHLGAVLTGSRVAVLTVDPLPEGETVAKLAGGRLRCFTREDAAAAWLESQRPRRVAAPPPEDAPVVLDAPEFADTTA